VGKRLLLAHSDLDIPPRGPSACEAAPLRALLLEGVGLAEMAAELD
jgi:hypothetical protein